MEQSLMQVAAGVHAVLPSDLDRHADLKVTFSEGDAVLEVEENGNLRRHTMRVRELQKKLNKAKAKLEEKQASPQKTETSPENRESPPLNSEKSNQSKSKSPISDGVKETILS